MCIHNDKLPVGSCLVMKVSGLTGVCGGRGTRHAIQIKQLCRSVDNRHHNAVLDKFPHTTHLSFGLECTCE